MATQSRGHATRTRKRKPVPSVLLYPSVVNSYFVRAGSVGPDGCKAAASGVNRVCNRLPYGYPTTLA
jgi:hypothetical protein